LFAAESKKMLSPLVVIDSIDENLAADVKRELISPT